MKPLVIGNKVAKLPIIQGGMGVGVSLGRLAGAVAREGAVGIISTAQIGFYRDDFETNTKESNKLAIFEQVALARKLSEGKGLIGVNIMVAMKDYADHVIASCKAGVDLIISGAGLPLSLPKLVKGFDVKIAPIVSSQKAASIIIRKWLREEKRLPDLVVIEGPKAGGHLGFKAEEVEDHENYDDEIVKIIDYVNDVAEENDTKIPVVVAGGVFSKEDIDHAMALGASGVQIASRFVCTHECDAADAYKEAYLKAKEEDMRIIKSPVGMPGRAIANPFLERIAKERIPVKRCFGCLAKCNPREIPYCITDALIRAVRGDVENGLIFCGANGGRINQIVSVHELLTELTGNMA